MNTICVLGSINIDLVIGVDKMPAVGETVLAHGIEKFPGGKGANQAVSASRLGQEVSFIGRVGDDENGQFLKALFEEENIETEYITIDPKEPTGLAMIQVDSLGNNAITVISGANRSIDLEQIRFSKDRILSSDIIVSQFEVPIDSIIEAFRIAKSAGITTLLNPSPSIAIPDELYTLTDVMIPNEFEASFITGIPIIQTDDAYAAAQALLDRGIKLVIITLGSQGAIYKTSGFQGSVPAIKVVPVDTTAAGDSFLGAVCSRLDPSRFTNKNIHEALTFANRVASIVVTRKGAQSSLPYLADL